MTCRPIICSSGYSFNGFKCILDNNTESIDIVSTLDCDERITYLLLRGDYSIRSCIVKEFERYFGGSDWRMFKQQASEFEDDLWIALKFTNESSRETLQTIRNESYSNILHDLNSCRLNEIEIIYMCSKSDYECSGQWISGSPTDFRRVFGVLNDSEIFLKDTVYFKADIIIYTLNHDFQIPKHIGYEVNAILRPCDRCSLIRLWNDTAE